MQSIAVKRAESISGNIHHCTCDARRLCEGGAHVTKKAMNLLHLGDSLSAEASESIGGDSLYVAVLLQVTKHHMDQKHMIMRCSIQPFLSRYIYN